MLTDGGPKYPFFFHLWTLCSARPESSSYSSSSIYLLPDPAVAQALCTRHSRGLSPPFQVPPALRESGRANWGGPSIYLFLSPSYANSPSAPVHRILEMGNFPHLGLLANSSSSRLVYFSAGAASVGFLILLGSLRKSPAQHAGIVPSPREAVLSCMSKEELEKLPYPPDALPGARDVDTPYGSIRVYEWGPEDGRKVLLIHGISTPSLALAPLARKLVKIGCRVMLFGKKRFSDSGVLSPFFSMFFLELNIMLSISKSGRCLLWADVFSLPFPIKNLPYF
jgi:hypothetical protein